MIPSPRKTKPRHSESPQVLESITILILRYSRFDLFDRLEQQLTSAERDSAERRSLGQLPSEGNQTTPEATAATPATPAADSREGRGPLLSQFRSGTWSRSFRFPAGIQREAIEAHYRDGLLSVKAPRPRR